MNSTSYFLFSLESDLKSFDTLAQVSETATFKDMGLDSLDEVEVVMALEEEFALEIPDAEADKIRSAPDAIEYIASHPMAK